MAVSWPCEMEIKKSFSTDSINKRAYVNKNNYYFPKINIKENSLEKTERKIKQLPMPLS